MPQRTRTQMMLDCVTFPLRALVLHTTDRFGLSSLASDRLDCVSREVRGFCLDVGCGPHNRLVQEFLNGHGIGIDVYPYEGLTADHLLDDPRHFPFPDGHFDTVTFIACLNHIPKPLRDQEMAEAWRVLKPGGILLITMGHPWAETLTHWNAFLYTRLFPWYKDMDSERGMDEEEAYFVSEDEIHARLKQAGFTTPQKIKMWTEWGLNNLYKANKQTTP